MVDALEVAQHSWIPASATSSSQDKDVDAHGTRWSQSRKSVENWILAGMYLHLSFLLILIHVVQWRHSSRAEYVSVTGWQESLQSVQGSPSKICFADGGKEH